METFVVRLFVAEDLEGLQGTVERPGFEAMPFHDAAELLDHLAQLLGPPWTASVRLEVELDDPVDPG